MLCLTQDSGNVLEMVSALPEAGVPGCLYWHTLGTYRRSVVSSEKLTPQQRPTHLIVDNRYDSTNSAIVPDYPMRCTQPGQFSEVLSTGSVIPHEPISMTWARSKPDLEEVLKWQKA